MSKPDYSNINALTAWDEGKDIKIACKIKDDKTGNWSRGVKTISGFEWYFALSAKDVEKKVVKLLINNYYDKGVVVRIEDYKDDWVKVYCNKESTDVRYGTGTSSNVKYLIQDLKREGVVLYESDLSMWKRFCIDNKIDVAGNLDILYFDIETDDTHDGIEIGAHTILSWAAMNSNGDEFFWLNEESTGGEPGLLKGFLNLMTDHDLISGWNSGGFDLPYIQGRLEFHNIDPGDMFKKKLHIDLMQRCAKVYSYEMFNIGLKGFSLNEVSRVFLGAQKVEHEEGIMEMYLNNPELLEEYNRQDVKLLFDLDNKLLITDLMIKECQWTGAFLDRFYIGELLDNYILRRTHEMGFFQHARPDWNEKQSLDNISIRGGFVMAPVPGVYDGVRVFDFKSLYPSIMVGFNIGRDSLNKELSDHGFVAMSQFLRTGTKDEIKVELVDFGQWKAFLESEKARLDPKDEHIQTANNAFFSKSKISFVGDLVQHLLNLRADWKAQAKGMDKDDPEYVNIQQSQGIVKEMANSMYGITGDKGSRYFDQSVAEAITLTGQFLNRLSSHFAQRHGYSTIYGDTDSIFVPIASDEGTTSLVAKVEADLKEYLESHVGVTNNIIELEYEKKFSRMIMLDKKRYAGKMVLYDGYATDKIFSRGTENIKKNTIRITREALVELIHWVVDDDTDISVAKAKTWVESLMSKMLNDDIDPDDLNMIIKVSKPPSKYKSKPLHVRLAERLINAGMLPPIIEGKRSWGTRLDYIVVKDPETGKQEGILREEWAGVWDRQYYWEVQVYAPIRRFLEVVFPSEDWGIYSIEEQDKIKRKKDREESKILKFIDLEEKRKTRHIKKAEMTAKKQKALEDKEKAKNEKRRNAILAKINKTKEAS